MGDDVHSSKAMRLGFSMRRPRWVAIDFHFAAAQKVKAQELEKALRGSGHIASFASF